MPIRFYYYIAVGLLTALSFFFGFHPPKNWGAALSDLAPIEAWWTVHAAHPLLAAFFAGLAFGTVLLPELWLQISPHLFPVKPRPDMDVGDAFDYLKDRSRWGIGRRYKPKGPRFLEEDIEVAIRNAAADGRITIWGAPKVDYFIDPTEQKLPPEFWAKLAFDLTTWGSTVPNGLHTYDGSNIGKQFCSLRTNRAELRREFPPAYLLRLAFDRTWRSRRNKTA